MITLFIWKIVDLTVPGWNPVWLMYGQIGTLPPFNGTYPTLGCHDIMWASAHWGQAEIDGLFVPAGKASKLLTGHLITKLTAQV